MLRVSSEHVGSTIVIELLTYDADDMLTDADETPTVYVRKGESALSPPLFEEALMTRTSLGTYQYPWDTRGLRAGAYMIEAHSIVDGLHRHVEKSFTLLSRGCTSQPS